MLTTTICKDSHLALFLFNSTELKLLEKARAASHATYTSFSNMGSRSTPSRLQSIKLLRASIEGGALVPSPSTDLASRYNRARKLHNHQLQGLGKKEKRMKEHLERLAAARKERGSGEVSQSKFKSVQAEAQQSIADWKLAKEELDRRRQGLEVVQTEVQGVSPFRSLHASSHS